MAGKTKTLVKANNILLCFTPSEPTWTATLLAKKLGMPVTTIHGILSELVALDFLTQSPLSKTYSIGSRYMEMGFLHANNSELNNIAHGAMRDLSSQTNHMVGLGVLYKGWMYVSLSVLSLKTLKDFRYLGPRLPAHMSAGGMAILAYLPPEIVQKYQEGLTADHDSAHLENELALVRKRGYSVSSQFFNNQRPCNIGTPVFGRERQVIAGLVILGPHEGFPDEELSRISTTLIRTAEDISSKSGHLHPLENYV